MRALLFVFSSFLSYWLFYSLGWFFLSYLVDVPRSSGWLNVVIFYSLLHLFFSFALSFVFFFAKKNKIGLCLCVLAYVGYALFIPFSYYPLRGWVLFVVSIVSTAISGFLFLSIKDRNNSAKEPLEPAC